MDERGQLKSKLTQLVNDAVKTYSYENAIFYADKLVSLEKNVTTVLQLAKAYFHNNEPARALHVLQSHQCVPTTGDRGWKDGPGEEVSDCILLAARCLERKKEWQACLQMLSAFDPKLSPGDRAPGQHATGDSAAWGRNPAAMKGAVYSLAGRCCEEMERRRTARDLYERSLAEDPFNYVSFHRSVDVHLPTEGGKDTFLKLRFRNTGVESVIQDLFSCKLSYWVVQDALVPKFEGSNEENWLATDDTMIMPEELRLTKYFGSKNPYILHCRAERLYYGHRSHGAHEVAKEVLTYDPFNDSCCTLYAACLAVLKRKTDLFQLGHELANRSPHSALSWFVVGCYYFTVGDYDKAGKFYYKATTSDPTFLPAWIAYGHTFQALEEGEHTMTAYRNAQRLFPKCHVPVLYMGMEHARSTNLQHAYTFLTRAWQLAGECKDPLINNEMGVTQYKNGKYDLARDHFLAAVSQAPVKSWAARPGIPVTDSQKAQLGVSDPVLAKVPNFANSMRDGYWEPVIFNLAHTLRKLKSYEEALHYYFISLAIRPSQASVLAAIGFTYHLMLRLDDAVQYYHMSLSIESNNTFARDMLNRALRDSFSMSTAPSSVSPPSLRPSILSSTSPPLVTGRLSSASQQHQQQHWDPMPLDSEPSSNPVTPNRRLHFPIRQD
ncbi:Anaphase-promoting complex subunit 6 [Diplonema papillatum]|nr:Anaphase-promoting complex subunit 6 [Diplonema papillatum]